MTQDAGREADETRPLDVLLVEDDADQAEVVRRTLGRQTPPFDVVVARDGLACLEALALRPYSIVLLDYSLPRMNGLEVLERIRQRGFAVPVVMITGQGDERVAVAAVKADAMDYVIKAQGYLTTLPTVLRKVAKQHAMALENTRLYQEVQERLTQTETLLAVSQQVGGTLDPTEMMRRVARETGRALGADMVGAFLADAEQRHLRPIAGYHVPKHLLGDFMAFAIPLKGHRILEEAFASHEPVWSGDIRADPRVDQETLRRFPHRSNLFCPMFARGAPIGGLFVTWFEQEHRFTLAEIQLVEGISRQAAIALANARLVEELKGRHSRVEALLEVTRQLSLIQPVTSLLASIAEACGRLLGSDSVRIRLVERDDLVLAATWGEAKQIMTRPRLKIGESLTGRVAATGEALLIMDPDRDPRLIPEHRQRLQGLGYRAWLCVPIKMGDRLVGVLSTRSKRPEGFSTDDLTTVTAFASQAAVILENTRLYQEVQRAYDELSQTQDQLIQAQKMEAVGRLAGGVAHDFNNLLLVIMGHGHLLLNGPVDGGTLRHRAGEIKKAADRAAALTRQLLAFSRKQILRPEVLDLNALVSDTGKMLRRLIGEDISLVTVLGSALGTVKADPGQIDQALMNLIVNARDAMPQGGRITIETANVELDEHFVRRHPGAQLGRYVRVSVSDTGCGMSAEVQSRIFEPFFTTKEPGKGTGLGLSTVYGIVKQHDGYISVDSAPGQGATFVIHLPRVERAPEASEQRPAPAPPRGSERVLLVEDESAVLALVRQVLATAGYTVMEATSGEEALKLCAASDGPIHLLLTDVIMPAMSGPELVRRLLPTRPDMKVLYMSGYPEDALGPRGLLEPGTPLVQKPFAPETLAIKVREVLDGSRQPLETSVALRRNREGAA